MRSQFAEDETDEALLEWLRTLDEEMLARILARRSDALGRPWPRRLDELARRLGSRPSVWLALRQVTTPGFQLFGAIQLGAALHGAPATTGQLAEQLGATVAQVEEVLHDLGELALAWTDPEGRVRVSEAIAEEFGRAANGFGPALREVAWLATVEQLKRTCAALGESTAGRKQQLVDTLLAFFQQPDTVRDLVEQAPEDTRELLLEGAWYGPYIGSHIRYLFLATAPRPRTTEDRSIEWAIGHGLIWQANDGGGVLPLEIGLALRGPAYRLPFSPAPPELDTRTVSPDSVAAECSAAAMRMVDRMNGVLAAAATDPIPLLKGGGVGVRAVRGLAKSMGASAAEVRLAVELAGAAGMLLPAEPPEPESSARGGKGRSRANRADPPPRPEGLVATDEAARWRAENSAGRLRGLLATWWELERAPLADDKAIRAVLGNEPSEAFADIRRHTIGLLSTLDSSSGVTGGMAGLLSWHVPMLTEELIDPVVDATLAEAELLGVVNSGSAGDLARTLRTGASTHDDPELVKTTDSLVASARTSALFGSDLTAIVTGTADTELSSLLDTAADREAQGSASTWRFNPASVRRAFDNGATADGLLEQLGAVAQGELPQPLVYLVNDVARSHGQLGVIAVRCAVVSDDTALLAEVAAHRKLAGLGLRQLAPTVLASGSAPAETLDALRNAGYAPMPRDTDGNIAVAREQPTPQAAPARNTDMLAMINGELVELSETEALPGPSEPDPTEHAARLLAAPVATTQPVARGEIVHQLHQLGNGYRTNMWYQLAWRLEAGAAVDVQYHEADGNTVMLRISTPESHDDGINVWSVQDDDYRTLDPARITPA